MKKENEKEIPGKLEYFEGKLKEVKNPSRQGWWRFNSLTMEEIEFRQWCLEQAIKWPREYAHGGGMMQGSYTPAHDIDLISRAKTIHDWVKGILK